MAIHLTSQRLLFLMVPGTGCSVIGRALIEQAGGRWLPEADIHAGGRVVMSRKHHDLQQMFEHGLINADQRRDLSVFATVRNPYDRLVTYWQRMAGDWDRESFAVRKNIIRRNAGGFSKAEVERRLRVLGRQRFRRRIRSRLAKLAGFNRWVQRTIRMYAGQDARSKNPDAARVLRLFPLTAGVDCVIRYEKLGEGLNGVLQEAGFGQEIELPRKNVTPGKRAFNEYWNGASLRLLEAHYGDALALLGHTNAGSTADRAAFHAMPVVGAHR